MSLSLSKNVFLDKFEVDAQHAVLQIKNVILLFQEQLKSLWLFKTQNNSTNPLLYIKRSNLLKVIIYS